MVRYEKRLFRPFFIICLPVLFLSCIGAAAWVLNSTHDVRLAVVFFLASFGPVRLMRWMIIWLSSPGERKVFAPALDREPILRLIRDCLGRGGGRLANGKKRKDRRRGIGRV